MSETFQQPAPTCPHCGHAMNTDEMLYGAPTCGADLFALAQNEGQTTVECPVCDQKFGVQGGYTPHYTTAFSEDELE